VPSLATIKFYAFSKWTNVKKRKNKYKRKNECRKERKKEECFTLEDE
jgi:hypothetical protein